MESRPQNPEFRNNPENFHPCIVGLFFFLSVSGVCISFSVCLCLI